MDMMIPADIESQYEGRWIAWDTLTRQVVGDGDTVEQAIEASREARDDGHLIWYHHILSRDSVIVGGL